MPKTVRLTVLLLAFLLSTTFLLADTTRTLKLELSPAEGGHFRVENLAGTMKVVPSGGTKVTAVATIHAESDTIAKLVRFEQVAGEGGVPTLRVIYPLEQYNSIRYNSGHPNGESLASIFGHSSTSTRYAGQRVKISESYGILLYADVEIQVPAGRSLEGLFHNEVGHMDAERLEGKFTFDTSSGEISLDHLKGEIKADTGSGNVKASDLSGSFTCDTGSGDCNLAGFDGEMLSLDAGSGDITVKSAKAKRISADTGSGEILVAESDMERFDAHTGSGDVTLESHGGRLTKVTADTGSGDVLLRLPREASFEARTDQGSGEIRMGYKDAEAILEHKQVIGYRRGDSRIHIDVNTGSGDLSIEPLR